MATRYPPFGVPLIDQFLEMFPLKMPEACF